MMDREALIIAIDNVIDRFRQKPNRGASDWSKVNGIEALAYLKDELERGEEGFPE